jgi:FtsP/CotA-like multicopper oxidase with cupredoxin domain
MKARIATTLTTLALLGGLAFLGLLGWMWWDSRLPGRYDVTAYGAVDRGGRPASAHAHFSVASLEGPSAGKADVQVTLTAQKATIRLESGQEVDAWTFDGRIPGPELRVRQGDLVQVTLLNKDVDDGVTIHWHGVDVPNAEDGVAGVTQDAVQPGGRYTYRFRAEQVGTFWYHTHQDASQGIKRGLYGALVILPRKPLPQTLDITLPVHNFSGRTVIGRADGVQRRAVRPGTQVRLRLINTDSAPVRIRLAGMQASIAAIDGADLAGGPARATAALEVGGGGRYDVVFRMPHAAVAAEVVSSKAALLLSPDGTGEPIAVPSDPVFDPATRSGARPLPEQQPDRVFHLTIGRKPGFIDGRPGYHWAINGKLYPRTPMFEVEEGDLVEILLVNDSGSTHPMHLHGHHFYVLARNGKQVQPWSTDTLNMLPHERYEVVFTAKNPGIWMLHCHNLNHAADGLTMHVMYAGAMTPFRAGKAARNDPE